MEQNLLLEETLLGFSISQVMEHRTCPCGQQMTLKEVSITLHSLTWTQGLEEREGSGQGTELMLDYYFSYNGSRTSHPKLSGPKQPFIMPMDFVGQNSDRAQLVQLVLIWKL